MKITNMAMHYGKRPFTGLLMLLLPVGAFAGEPTTGRQVMDRVESNDTSKNSRYVTTMVLIDRKRQQRKRVFKQWRLKIGKDSKTMMKFMAPPLDKNTGLLTFNYKNKKSDQWLYLPNLNDTKRILSSEKGKSFMGSDFYYEDFEKKDLDDFSYKLLGKKTFQGQLCYLVESTPKKGTDSAYSKVKSWIRADQFVDVKTLFYENGKLTKVLYQRKIKRIQGILTTQELEMKSVRKKHTTILRLGSIKYNTNVGSSFFTKRFLQRKL